MAARIFLLSPASCAGNRARLLLGPAARSPLAGRLRTQAGAPIGEVFAFISQLYFRGKLAYARGFARVPQGWSLEESRAKALLHAKAPLHGEAPLQRQTVVHGEGLVHGETLVRGEGLVHGVFVITTSRGLVHPDTPVTADTLREFAGVELRLANEAYTRPLETTARAVAARLAPEDEVVLLGSIASDKYVAVLRDVFGDRLRFPSEFVGRGDMSRGGLMLRCLDEGRELTYVPLAGADRHGARPPRLERRR
jgi:hypothetical protein